MTVVNRHDFGVYHTLGLAAEAEAASRPHVAAYRDAVEDGLGFWHAAGFIAPVVYHGAAAVSVRTLERAIVGAWQTTRRNPDGRFPIADFARLHANLAAAFPAEAEAFRAAMTAVADRPS